MKERRRTGIKLSDIAVKAFPEDNFKPPNVELVKQALPEHEAREKKARAELEKIHLPPGPLKHNILREKI